MPGDRPPLPPLRSGRVPHHGHLDGVDETAKLWRIGTDRGDTMRAKFVICANGTLSKPKLSKIAGMEDLRRPFVPFLALGLRLHRRGSLRPRRQGRRHHRHRGLGGAGDPAAGQGRQGTLRLPAHPLLDRPARRPATDPDWIARLKPGWQQARRQKHMRGARRRPRQEGRAGRSFRGKRRSAARRTPTSTT